MSEAVVIIGAGQAGAQLAQSLRQGGHAGPVRLICDEGHLPYQRPPLSKRLCGSISWRSRRFARGSSPATFHPLRKSRLKFRIEIR